jgi:hypothetical protein
MSAVCKRFSIDSLFECTQMLAARALVVYSSKLIAIEANSQKKE